MKDTALAHRKKTTKVSIATNTTSQRKKRAIISNENSFSLLRYLKKSVRKILLSRVFQRSFAIISVVVVATFSLYGVYHFIEKTFANEVIISKSEIVSRVSKLTPLPPGEPYEVVRVQNGAKLKQQNDFYNNVEEGDYVLVYPDTAIIYDLRNNVIVAMRKTPPQDFNEEASPSSSLVNSMLSE